MYRTSDLLLVPLAAMSCCFPGGGRSRVASRVIQTARPAVKPHAWRPAFIGHDYVTVELEPELAVGHQNGTADGWSAE